MQEPSVAAQLLLLYCFFYLFIQSFSAVFIRILNGAKVFYQCFTSWFCPPIIKSGHLSPVCSYKQPHTVLIFQRCAVLDQTRYFHPNKTLNRHKLLFQCLRTARIQVKVLVITCSSQDFIKIMVKRVWGGGREGRGVFEAKSRKKKNHKKRKKLKQN